MKRLVFIWSIAACVVACDPAQPTGGGTPTPPAARQLVVDRKGEGTIRSTPPGIACGQTCEAEFPDGTEVALEAVPEGNTSFFGWWGDCQGTGVCRVTLDGVRRVSARFEAVKRPAWKTRLGGAEHDFARDVAVDATGHVYLAMQTQRAGTSAPALAVVKLTPSGEPIWTTIVGDSREDLTAGAALALAPDGGVFVTGGAGAEGEAFLAAIGARGDLLWNLPLDAPGEPRDVAAHDTSVVVVGDQFIGAWNARGKRAWIRRAPLRARAVAVSRDGTIAVGGTLDATAKLGRFELRADAPLTGFVALYRDDGPIRAWTLGAPAAIHDVAWSGDALIVAGARQGAWVAAYGPDGAPAWEREAQGGVARSLAALPGGVALTGSFARTLALGRLALTAREEDTFLALLGADGEPIHLQRLGGGRVGAGGRATALPDGELIVAASFSGEIDVGGGAIRAEGATDALVARLLR